MNPLNRPIEKVTQRSHQKIQNIFWQAMFTKQKQNKQKKKKNHINVLVLWVVCFYCECSLSTFGVQAFVSPFAAPPPLFQVAATKKKKNQSH